MPSVAAAGDRQRARRHCREPPIDRCSNRSNTRERGITSRNSLTSRNSRGVQDSESEKDGRGGAMHLKTLGPDEVEEISTQVDLLRITVILQSSLAT